MKQLKMIPETIASLVGSLDRFKSERLRVLLSPVGEKGGLFPDILAAISEFEQMIVWKKVAGATGDKEIPEPAAGLDEQFDGANERVDRIKAKLEEYLTEMKSQFKDRRLCYSHAKQRYELEVPEDLVKGKRKPHDFELMS